MEIAIVYSLTSKRMSQTEYGETDNDTLVIAEMVRKGLLARGYTATLYPISEDKIEDIASIKTECIFNLIEWCGRDIQLAERAFVMMRKLQIPVTGSSERLYVLTGDKTQVKLELQKIGAPTPHSQVFVTGRETFLDDFKYPVIVKPSLEHCSTGLTREAIADNAGELQNIVNRQILTFRQPALVEEFIVGRELLVYLIEENGKVRVLPIEEMIFAGKDKYQFQTYDTKWNVNSVDYSSTDVQVAKLDKTDELAVKTICQDTFKQLGLYGYARFDLRLRSGIPYILETNANPSVYDASEELVNIEDEVIWGIKFPDYLQLIVKSAFDHFLHGEMI